MLTNKWIAKNKKKPGLRDTVLRTLTTWCCTMPTWCCTILTWCCFFLKAVRKVAFGLPRY